ncbi:MAG TPA: hypothetical protein VNA57_14475 [Acidimicrobiales bacterium]|nr:hypothetical protein [Acidimicrobiales bacterium]
MSVSVPPSASTYNDGTIRPVKAYYGANAVCAVWLHDLPGTADDHDGAVGNQYTLYPI